MNAVSANCIFSTVSSYKAAVDAALNDFEMDESLPAGEAVYYGAADKAVKIVADYTRLSTFTETDYNNAVRALMEGNATVSDEEMTEGTAHVVLSITQPPSGLDESSVDADNTASAAAENTGEASSEETGEEEYTEEGNTEDNEEDYEEENTEEEYTEEENTEEEQ